MEYFGEQLSKMYLTSKNQGFGEKFYLAIIEKLKLQQIAHNSSNLPKYFTANHW